MAVSGDRFRLMWSHICGNTESASRELWQDQAFAGLPVQAASTPFSLSLLRKLWHPHLGENLKTV